jgi:elongation factor Ts
MPEFTAKDVKALRDATGAGMMDAKKALQENDGDMETAGQWLREKGLAKVAKLEDRDNTQGSVTAVIEGNVGAIVELKCETDFSAKADDFTSLVQDMAELVVAKGVDAVGELSDELDNLRIAKKENIELGSVVRFEAAAGNVLDTYLHIQDGRGVNAVLVELAGGTRELAHDIAVHIAFAKPPYLTRDEVPADAVEKERQALLDITKAEGKPEQAWPKIVEGRLNAWFKDQVLLEQGFVRDDKQTIAQFLGDATLVRFAQVFIGA